MSANERLFYEKQKFSQWWIYALFVLLWVLLGVAWVWQFVLHKPFGTHPMPNGVLVFFLVFNVLLTLLLFTCYLETSVFTDRIEVKFVPFQFKPRVFRLSQAQQCYVRTYSPLREYGGWGIRFGLGGRAFNVKGNHGLQLVLANKQKFLIGTQKPNELKKVIDLIYPSK